MSSRPPELARVKRAAAKRDRAGDEYRAVLLAAHDAGHSFATIGRAAGVSREAVRALIARQRPGA
jgi:DNA-directed RNA polymerase specialized sigma24 family protein